MEESELDPPTLVWRIGKVPLGVEWSGVEWSGAVMMSYFSEFRTF